MAVGFKKLSYGDSFDSSKYDTTEVIDNKLQKKVDKIDGKGLSSNDLTNELLQLLQDKYTKEETNKLVNDLDTDLQKQIDDIKLILSTDDVDFDTLQELVNALKNNVASINDIFTALSQKASKNDLPTKVSDLENDLGYLTQHQDISGKVEKTYVDEELQKKVDKIDGKGLSSNDYTTDEKNKLASLNNYDDTEIKQDVIDLEKRVDYLEIPSNTLFGTDEENNNLEIIGIDETENESSIFADYEESYSKTESDMLLSLKEDKTNLKALAYRSSLTKSDIGLGNVLNVESYSKTESDNKFATKENINALREYVSEVPKMFQTTCYIPLFISCDPEFSNEDFVKSNILQLKNILGDSVKKKGYAQLEALVGLYDSESGSELCRTGLKQKNDDYCFYGTVHDRVEIDLYDHGTSFGVFANIFSEDGNIPITMSATVYEDGSFSRWFEDINGERITFEQADSLCILERLSINGFLILYQED